MEDYKNTNWYKNKIKRNEEYNKNKIQRISLNLNKEVDSDIIDFVNNIDNKQGYIKQLIRDDIKRNGNNGN